MSESKWDIYLLGETQLGVERSALVRNLATLFKKDATIIEKMLRKPRSLIKANTDLATATKYKTAIDKAGGLCELTENTEQLFPHDALSPVQARTTIPTPSLSVVPIEAVSAETTNAEPATSPADELTYDSPYLAPQSRSESAGLFCVKCGASLYTGMTHCPKCLAEQPHLSSKSKVTAGFLAFFLGGLGVHRFYLGQWWGVFYLLLWGTLIPSIVSIIEAFVFWFTPNEKWQRKYGQVPAQGPGMIAAMVVGAILFVMIVGILAAVALPAYQDYTIRAKVSAAAPLVSDTRAKVENVILKKNFFPSENILAGLPENISNSHVRSIQLGEGAQLIVTYNAASAPTIIWTPKKSGSTVTWSCQGGTMRDQNRPQECRGGAVNSTAVKAGAVNSDSTRPQSANIRIYSDDKKVSLIVPGSWKGDRQLNAEALLGVANLAEESYTLVLAESKQDFDAGTDAATYLSLVVANLQSGDDSFRVVQPDRTVAINGRPGQQQVVALAPKGVKIVYILTVLESDEDFYIVYAWTLEHLYQKNQPVLRKVSNSLTLHR